MVLGLDHTMMGIWILQFTYGNLLWIDDYSQPKNKRENTISTRKNNNVDTVIQPAVSQLIVASPARPFSAPQRQVISSSGHRAWGLRPAPASHEAVAIGNLIARLGLRRFRCRGTSGNHEGRGTRVADHTTADSWRAHLFLMKHRFRSQLRWQQAVVDGIVKLQL